MKELLISCHNSIDGKDHSFRVLDYYVEENDPIYDDIKLVLHTEDGITVNIKMNGFGSIDPSMHISLAFPHNGERSYYFSENSYIEHVGNSNYWSKGAYYESNGVQAKYMSVNYKKNNGKCIGIQKIWSRYKEKLDNSPWPNGHEQKIPMEKIEQYEAALTQLPRVKELIEYAMEEFERKIPGIKNFLLLDKRFNRLNRLMGIEVPDEISIVMNDMLYLDKPTNIEGCDLLNSQSNSLKGKNSK